MLAKMQKAFGCVMLDITSRCNLRCPFCSNDWRTMPDAGDMDEAMFAQALRLLPYAANTFFFMSCVFEPTVHPKFAKFVDMLPEEGKQKAFFTTNLSTPIAGATFDLLATANLHHINISVESLNPSVYEEMRRGAKFSTFIRNLECLVAACRAAGDQHVPLHFITMALRQNLNELPSLVSVLQKRYLAAAHEIRSPFAFSLNHMQPEWRDQSILTAQEWHDSVVWKVPGLEQNVSKNYPPGEERPPEPGLWRNDLRITSDGRVNWRDDQETCSLDEFLAEWEKL